MVSIVNHDSEFYLQRYRVDLELFYIDKISCSLALKSLVIETLINSRVHLHLSLVTKWL